MAGAAAAGKAGGFLTGWRGVVLFLTGAAVVGVLAITGILGSRNTYPRFSEAMTRNTGSTFGLDLYDDCVTQNATYPVGGWEQSFELDGGGTITSVPLSGPDALDILAELGNLNTTGEAGPRTASYRNRPEVACYTVCVQQLGEDECSIFTYDGLTNDSCRFLRPGATPPQEVPKPFREDQDGFFLIYNGTCMTQVRDDILAGFSQPAPGLTRPVDPGVNSPPSLGARYVESLVQSLSFLRMQWAGTFPRDLMDEVAPWRVLGFVGGTRGNLDSNCGDLGSGRSGTGSFASGDHIVVSMALAEELGVLSLARQWWQDVFEAGDTRALVFQEIARQSQFLATASALGQGSTPTVLIGVGDQVNRSADPPALVTFSDYGRADRALQAGPPPEGQPFEQPTTVEAECTFADEETPAPDVAAHVAAALALSAMSLTNFTAADEDQRAELVEPAIAEAERLLRYSRDHARLSDIGDPSALGVDVLEDGVARFGGSMYYPVSGADNVFAHQLWASCALYQATGRSRYLQDAVEIWQAALLPDNATRTAGGTGPPPPDGGRAFYPVPSYDNPAWYGIMCLAQSIPTYSGLETRADLNVTDVELIELLLRNGFVPSGTRLFVTNHIWSFLVKPWIQANGSSDDIKRTGTFPYADIPITNERNGNEEQAPGMLAKSAAAAALALMWADLPGVNSQKARLARCMARDTVDYILGDNPAGFSYQVNNTAFGTDAPLNPYHKDAACPPDTVLASQFSEVFSPDAAAAANIPGAGPDSDTRRNRLCDFLTFYGDPNNVTCSKGWETGGAVSIRPDPVLDNSFSIRGALVSWFDPAATGESNGYRDIRGEITGTPGACEPETEDNSQARVGIDYSAALAAAVAGVASLPTAFFDEPCPSPAEAAQMAETVE